jgi:hypothetical protein
VLTLAAAAWAVTAKAAKPGQAFRLEYWAQGRCPDAIEFARQIQIRAPRLRPAEGAEPALGFYAELAEQAGSATGRLTARSADGREVVREVRGPTCDDVATALALIAALAADPSQPVDPPLRSPAGPPRSPAPLPGAAPAHQTRPLVQTSEPAREQAWTYGVGGGLEFDSSIAPSPGYGLAIEFDAQGKGGSPWQPLLALSANRAAAPDTETRGGTASFTWVAFRLAACPVRWPEDKPLFVRPCAFLDAGVLSGQVSLGAERRDQSKTWFASGGFLRIEALAAEALSLQLDGGVTVPLRRYSFGVGSGAEDAFRVPTSGILGRIGLSYRFQ